MRFNQAVDRAGNRFDDPPADILTCGAEGAAASHPQFFDHFLAIPEKKEQPEQHKAEQHQPVQGFPAERGCDFRAATVDFPFGQDRNLARLAELLLP